jgi:branched-subunit amino acid ABC-type transport system permease component
MLLGQIILNSLVLGTQVLLLAIPLFLIHSVSKIYHLGLGGIGVGVAYAIYWGVTGGLSFFWAGVLGVIVAIILGVISYGLLESSARNKEKLFGLLISFSMGISIEAIVAMIFGSGGLSFVKGVLPTYSLGSLYLTLPGVIALIAGVILAIVFFVVLRWTPWGRKLQGISEDDYLAASLTINAPRTRMGVYIIATLITGFIGFLTVFNTALTPTAGFNMLILAFIALLVGGVFDIKGTIVASYILVLIPELIVGLSGGSHSISLSWKMVIVFVIAFGLLLIRPNGLFTVRSRTT